MRTATRKSQMCIFKREKQYLHALHVHFSFLPVLFVIAVITNVKWLVVWTTGIFNNFLVFLFFFPFFFLSQNRSYQYSPRTVSSRTESGAPWNDRDMIAETRTWSCIFELNFWLPSTLSTLELINLNSWTNLLENRSFTRWRNFTIRTRMLCQNAYSFKFMFSLGNKETIEKTGLIQ